MNMVFTCFFETEIQRIKAGFYLFLWNWDTEKWGSRRKEPFYTGIYSRSYLLDALENMLCIGCSYIVSIYFCSLDSNIGLKNKFKIKIIS